MVVSTCEVCGLRNDESKTACLRCGDPLGPNDPGARGPWREDDVVVVEKGSALPGRCVRCGVPSGSSRLRQRYYWHHPALYLLAFGALLVYAIVALSIRKSATLDLGLCRAHANTRRRAIAVGWALGGLGLLLCGVSVGVDRPELITLGVLVALTGLVWGTRSAAPLRAAGIDEGFVRLKGAGPAFLRALPLWRSLR
jgi:hypothetical protein